VPNANNGLRSFETGVNISAIAKYWGLGGGPISETTATPSSIPAGTWVPIDDNHHAITYSGKWSYSTTSPGYYQATCHFSSAAGSCAEYSFTGTAIRWIGGRNDNHGDAEVYIDGALRKSVNTRASSWLPRQVLYEKSGLPNARHIIKIVVKNGGFQDVDAFVYCTGEPLP
jgi:FAD/FMN-containing dehydrogenase